MMRFMYSSAAGICLTFLFYSCRPQQKQQIPFPTQIYEGQKEGEREEAYERYLELSHRTAPGVDWRAIEAANRQEAMSQKEKMKRGVADREDFAGGLVQGDWHERGSINQAGSVIATDYYAATNHIYTMGSSGIMFRGNLDGSDWGPVNDDVQFENNVLQVLPNLSGEKRIVAAQGKYLYYSDDDGDTWTQSTGLSYYDGWGYPLNLVELDNHDLYYLVYTWISSPWGSGFHLYRSTNRGASWSLIQTFPLHSTRRVGIWQPFETNELYLVDNNQKLYSISGSTLSLLNNITGVPTDQKLWFSGYKNGGTYRFYILTNTNQVYRSIDNGVNWTLVSTLNPSPWDVGLFASPFIAQTLYYGEVEFWKTTNDGSNWSKQNNWWAYYSNTNFLHADMMYFVAARTSGGTPFLLIANHGGMHVSYDNMTTTSNIGLNYLNVGQYYDHISAMYNGQQYLFVGTQDQGMQRFSNASGTGFISAVQVISGDYVKMHLSRNSLSLWEEYPGGDYHYYYNPFTANSYNSEYAVSGNGGVNAQLWIMPSNPVGAAAENAILVGGGTLTADDGSHLIKLTAATSPPYTISAFQFSYNFRPNANNGNSYITAVAQSTLNTSKYYVGMADGTFFYSNNGGTTWQKTSSFNGPGNGFLYGTCILPSHIHPDRLFFAGSGYNNPGVYMSVNGGVSFTPLSTGLPATFVTELEMNDTESMLFAATDAGPYVYIFSQGQWYSLNGATTPLQTFKSVEYLSSSNTARFTTYGRGVWDLSFVSVPLPVQLVRFEAEASPEKQVDLYWLTASEAGNDHFDVEHSTDGIRYSPIGQVKGLGSNSRYTFRHTAPAPGKNYYRLKQVDADAAHFTYSDIRQVTIDAGGSPVVYPNPVPPGGTIHVSQWAEEAEFTLFDQSGKVVYRTPCNGPLEVPASGLPPGVYYFRLQDFQNQAQFSGKIVIGRS